MLDEMVDDIKQLFDWLEMTDRHGIPDDEFYGIKRKYFGE